MTKSKIAILFSLIFTTFIIVIPVLSIINHDHGISLYLEVNEEESKGTESNKTIELTFIKSNHSSEIFEEHKPNNLIGYQFKSYTKTHLNLVSPPPESFIL